MIHKTYYSPLSSCSSFWAWLSYSWRLNAIDGGYMRLGQYREIGTRVCGVEFMQFDSKEQQERYEKENQHE